MLRHLQIQNYAILDLISLDFSSGLQVITGETGAGKSIMAGALALILGARAEGNMLKDREKKCIVEGLFDGGTKKEIIRFLQENELDSGEELVLRREISPGGKSRAFVNDTPVNLEQLRRLSVLLVDLHQQFDTLQLGQAGFQLAVLDALAGHQALLAQYRAAYRSWQQVKRKLEEMQRHRAQAEQEKDYRQFLLDELEQAAFKENELEEGDEALKRLSHAEGIQAALQGLLTGLEEGEQPVLQQLRSFISQLEVFTTYHAGFPDLVSRLRSVHIELQDIAHEVSGLESSLSLDPKEMERLNERMHTGYKLLKKHHFTTTAELLTLQFSLEAQQQGSVEMAEAIHSLEKEAAKSLEEAGALAERLSANRMAQVKGLEEKVNGLLKKVGMPNARIRVQLTASALSNEGKDTVEFLFDANKSDRFDPVRQVASGGELSRLMLCIKSLVAQSMDMPTLLFDEIDAGISGEAAKQVGLILKDLARQRQVICITHQPQIAGKGDAHFFVSKESRQGKVTTRISLLEKDARILAIAQMLSGEKPTPAALENAREMIA